MINKIIYTILFVLILLFSIVIIKDTVIYKDYVLEYNHNNKLNIIVVRTNNLNKEHIFNRIKKIYQNNNDIEQNINQKIKDYLLKQSVKKFSINSNDIILLSNNLYKIGLPNPNNNLEIIKIIEAKNKCIATIKADKYFSSITVISNNNCQNYALNLKDKTIDEGKNYNQNIDIIWYTFDNEIISTNNTYKYM